MRKYLITLLLMAGSFVQAADVELLQSSIVDNNALNFSDALANNNRNINGRTFQRFPMATFKGYQYATYFDDNRNVCVGRRKLPSGAWEVIRFTDYMITSSDSHNVAAIGICEADGTIHLAFDHHADPLNYRVSVLDAATDPESTTWSTNLFGSVTDQLGSVGSLGSVVTYPTFFNAPNGNLMLYYRRGGSGNGDGMIQEYDGTTHDWTTGLGEFIASTGTYNGTFTPVSTSRCPYINGISYAGTRLHATWGWRETPDSRSNHDLCYAYSDDDGRTWYNNAGTLIGTTGSSFITVNSPGVTVASIAQDIELSNQYTHYAFADGSCHVMVYHENGSGTRRYHHYWRDAAGTWSSTELSFTASRPKLTGDDDGNLFLAYVSGNNPRIAKGVPNAGHTSWTWSSVYTQPVSEGGEGHLDYTRWEKERVLTFYGQERPATTAEVPSPLHIYDYKVSEKASQPDPAHESLNVFAGTSLAWATGINANTHRIYLGTNASAIATATTNSPEYMGEQGTASYDPPGYLPVGTTHYWRIDEVESGGDVHQGLVWSFVTDYSLPPETLIAGWDTWNNTTAPGVSFTVTNVTASATASAAVGNWNNTDSGADPGRGSSDDASWGAFDGNGVPASAVTTVGSANFTLLNGTTDGQITFTINNTGADDIILDRFHFDAVAYRPNAARTWAVNVLAGSDITVTNVYTSGLPMSDNSTDAITHLGGGLSGHDQHDDIDLSLAGLADNTLEAGGTAIIQLAFSNGTGSGGGHHLFVDNVGISGEIVSLPVLAIGMSGSNVEITWTGTGHKLQSDTSLTNNVWSDVPGGTASPVLVPPTNPATFFRLIEQ